jgi:hypothetical protein
MHKENNMKKTWKIGLSCLVLLGAGCGGMGGAPSGTASEAELASAVPDPQGMTVNLPGGNGSAQLVQVGTTSSFYVVTRVTTDRVNGHVAFALGVLWAIVHTPPTSIQGNVGTWGPFTPTLSPVTYRLVVTRIAQGQFTYHLDGRPKSSTAESDFRAIVTGAADPSTPIGHGTGSFTLDLTAANALDPIATRNGGTIAVAYDLSQNPKSLTVHFAGVADGMDGQPATADYAYSHADNDDGTFKFTVDANLAGTAARLENGSFTSRWNASGAGRGDVTFSGGDAPAGGASAVQCWDSNFKVVYYMGPELTEGNASSCAYASAL